MSIIKKFLNWLFQPYEPKQKQSASGKVIRCHDCGEHGYFATSWDFEFDYHISRGWQMVWVGLKPLFLCEKCQRKRRELVK